MEFPTKYTCLQENRFSEGNFTLVPIRYEDRIDIMQWRNEQIYHLRQVQPLTLELQDNYFNQIVAKLFTQAQPTQVLFSLLENDICIGYGGLVHINWIDRNAEVSFIMNTALEKNRFQEIWVAYLHLLKKIAFSQLTLHKLYTYAFDLRPHLYSAIETAGFIEEARLKEHCLFEGKAIDVRIHTCIDTQLKLVSATTDDCLLTYSWASNPEIRKYSFNQEPIPFESHQKWFSEKCTSNECLYYILKRGQNAIGSIRIDLSEHQQVGLISYLIDPSEQKKGYGLTIIELLETKLLDTFRSIKLRAFVTTENTASIKIFEKAGYSKILNEEKWVFEKIITS